MATYFMLSDQGERVTSITSIQFHYSGPHPFKKKVTDPHIVIEVLVAEVNGRTKEYYNIQQEALKAIEIFLRRRNLSKYKILIAIIIDLYVLKQTPQESVKVGQQAEILNEIRSKLKDEKFTLDKLRFNFSESFKVKNYSIDNSYLLSKLSDIISAGIDNDKDLKNYLKDKIFYNGYSKDGIKNALFWALQKLHATLKGIYPDVSAYELNALIGRFLSFTGHLPHEEYFKEKIKPNLRYKTFDEYLSDLTAKKLKRF